MQTLYENSELPAEYLSAILRAYREEKELLLQERDRLHDKQFHPLTLTDLKNVFLQCPHAFIESVEVTSKSHASRCKFRPIGVTIPLTSE